MLNYYDIEGRLRDELVDSRKHLFKVGSILVSFWKKRGNAWRIITSLSTEAAKAVANSLRIALTLHRFNVEEAWEDLSRPKFRDPPMHSQIVGIIINIDTIGRIWSALDLIASHIHEYEGDGKRITISLPKLPRGYEIEDIIERLGENIGEDQCPSEVEEGMDMRGDRGSEYLLSETNSIEEYVAKLRSRGISYRGIEESVLSAFGVLLDRNKIYRILRKKKLAGSRTSA